MMGHTNTVRANGVDWGWIGGGLGAHRGCIEGVLGVYRGCLGSGLGVDRGWTEGV